MLIETPIAQNDVVSLKVLGDEVIGRFVEQTDTEIVLDKPMLFVMGPQGFGLMPFMVSAPKDAKIRLKLSVVSAVVKSEQTIAKQYLSQSTGLAIV